MLTDKWEDKKNVQKTFTIYVLKIKKNTKSSKKNFLELYSVKSTKFTLAIGLGMKQNKFYLIIIIIKFENTCFHLVFLQKGSFKNRDLVDKIWYHFEVE